MLILIISRRNVKTLEYTAYDQRSVTGGRQGYPADCISSSHTLGLGLRFDCVQLHVPYQQAEIGQNTEQSATDNMWSLLFHVNCGDAGECGEMPLEIRRTQQELNFAIKLKTTAR